MARSMGRNAVQTVVVHFGSTVLGLTTSIITARMLGPSARGIFTLVTTLPHTLSALVKLGLAQGAVYSIRKEQVSASTVASHLFFISIGSSIPIVLAVILFRGHAADLLLKGANPLYLLLALPLVPLLLIESYFFAVLQALERFVLFNQRVMVTSVLAPVTMFIALVVCHGTLAAAILANLGVIAAVDLWLIATVFALCPLRWSWDNALARRMLQFGVKSYLQTLATHLHMRIDVYLVAAFLTPADVAFYAIATRFAELLFHIPESLGMVIYPRQAASNKDGAEDLTATACRHTIFSSLLGSVMLLTLGTWLIRVWYGAAYAPAAAPLPYLVAGEIMMSLFFIFTRNFTSQNRQELNLMASAVALIVNFAMNLILIPRMGIAGAGLSSALSYSCSTAILARIYFRESGKSLRDVVLLRGTDIAAYRRVWSEVTGRFAQSAEGSA